ncbi:MAG: hypothetical protein KBF93_05365 [Leptospiraceae bacterium]|nr:hypothetical protein [Leptospiraceae bacterium]
MAITLGSNNLPQRHKDTERFKESLFHNILLILVIQLSLLFYYNMKIESKYFISSL